jgi:hypothetical protein
VRRAPRPRRGGGRRRLERRPVGGRPHALAGRRLPRPGLRTDGCRRARRAGRRLPGAAPWAVPAPGARPGRPGRRHRRPGRRLPAPRPGAVPDLVRRGPPGPRAARHVRLRPSRTAPRRAGRRHPHRRPGLLSDGRTACPRAAGRGRCARVAGRRRPGADRRRGQWHLGCRAGAEGEPPLCRSRRGLRRLRAPRPPPHLGDGAGSRYHGPVHAPPRPDGPGHPGHLLRPTRRPRRTDHGGRHAAPARPVRRRAIRRGGRRPAVDQGGQRLEHRPPDRAGRPPHRVGGRAVGQQRQIEGARCLDAGGQAVQCANLALSLPEGAGLPVAGVYP